MSGTGILINVTIYHTLGNGFKRRYGKNFKHLIAVFGSGCFLAACHSYPNYFWI
ncbi:MAG: hypothetical protein ACRC11_15330 [Xenococcaceae cyanobacterium]